ncbi:group III truncated hemoglobin [Maribacter sp. HTCC2170]|uniref:group III truncated hemoglobin n=1 Tax=Maribacter sp. (strain HTCC2170 / KCCM 42371) TaxID=313603 RepID=UPI00006BD25D|nr:group III truncated hemoglobin [Maribacter sp. HTCC2170]EAR02363.1 sec-independent protein translocase protein TatC [Maribacter sp. HTCC2170]
MKGSEDHNMKKKHDIGNRADITLLVETFYTKIRADEVLGPIFNGIIKDWGSHLTLLIDFWETQLLLIRKYHGNPILAHQEVDEKMSHEINPEHFGLWLNLWFETLDELFEGETVWVAKNRAQKMSTMLYMKMYENRTQNS